MHKNFRKAAVLTLCVAMAASALAGCSKEKKADNSVAVVSLKDGGSLNLGTANMIFRYDQAQFENGVGSFIKSYYGDLWNSDITGSGQPYGVIFKADELEDMEKMLVVEANAAEYKAELSDEEKAAIDKAATEFISSNTPALIEKMSAEKDNVVRMLELKTMKAKAEVAMVEDVDTNVSDEEAAQRTVRYVSFVPVVEEEELEAATEGASESVAEEAETAAAVAETEVKTGSADVEEAQEAATESALETPEAETEEEVDPAMLEARAKSLAAAEAFLEQAKAEGADFAALAEEAAAQEHVSTSTWTFGDNDTYPAAEVIEATKGLADGELVDHVIEANNNYYVVCVEKAFDEEATEQEKASIVRQRKSDKIAEVYEALMGAAEFTVNEEVWNNIVFDVEFTQETQAAEEAPEAVTEAAESVAEVVTEAATE